MGGGSLLWATADWTTCAKQTLTSKASTRSCFVLMFLCCGVKHSFDLTVWVRNLSDLFDVKPLAFSDTYFRRDLWDEWLAVHEQPLAKRSDSYPWTLTTELKGLKRGDPQHKQKLQEILTLVKWIKFGNYIAKWCMLQLLWWLHWTWVHIRTQPPAKILQAASWCNVSRMVLKNLKNKIQKII